LQNGYPWKGWKKFEIELKAYFAAYQESESNYGGFLALQFTPQNYAQKGHNFA